MHSEIAKATNAGFMITDDEMKNRDGKSMKVKSWNLLDELSRVRRGRRALNL
jgi:hypothetical protein